eukprot:CAMPEP_0176099062 /NCGR_PEP_ID=MMETSP0120_2-20121206/49677_1 /TAXON_ID=160619 /ORGANISM="Kryptoperidinium foliaceum, Strain CCMP 1326" /LENGTH=58 /DNA_ID=CAMNT_0017433087 /DNA_START=125 /DNA_END=301 /DNA_ORIENTATION=-
MWAAPKHGRAGVCFVGGCPAASSRDDALRDISAVAGGVSPKLGPRHARGPCRMQSPHF